MKGIVFNLLNEMVEEKFGMEAWDALLQTTHSDGIYVASESYPDEELLALVSAAEEATGIPANDLVFEFGKFMLPGFYRSYPSFFDSQTCLKQFLLTVDEVIHVEVKKLFPHAGVPEFDYNDAADNELTMIYRSPRKLCRLAEGLIAGSAAHFAQSYQLDHEICMHDGSDHCVLHITLAA